MQLSVTFRHMDSSDALKQYTEEKVAKVAKLLPRVVSAHVILGVEKLTHKCEVLIDSGHLHCRGSASSENMYKSIDEATDKIIRQVKRHLGRLHHYQPRIETTEVSMSHRVVSVPTEQEDKVPTLHQVLHTEQMAAKPMTIEEAVMNMDVGHHEVFIFLNVDSEHLNVIYRRADGHYGLIETTRR